MFDTYLWSYIFFVRYLIGFLRCFEYMILGTYIEFPLEENKK